MTGLPSPVTPSRPREGVNLCPTCQQPLRPPPVLCVCGHPASSHHMTGTGALTWCSHYSPGGRCKCQVMELPKEASS